jgi:hypothetical protein
MSTFFTREHHNYDNLWSLEDFSHLNTFDSENNPMSILQIIFKRKSSHFLFTLPSYIIYMLTLLMFILPQKSNQRLIIGSICLVMDTILIFMMSKSLPSNDIDSWPVLGKIYLFNMVIMSSSLIFSAFIINIGNNEHTRTVPDWLKKVE